MEIVRSTVPGAGTMHHFTTRDGQRFGVLVGVTARQLVVFGAADPDVPEQTIVLDHDEADQVADVLHSRSIADQLVALERGLAAVTGQQP